MKRRSKNETTPEELRNRIIGMGEGSLRKNYFPILKKRVAELERYKSLLDQAHDGICLINPEDGHFVECNLTGKEILSYPMSTISSLYDLIEDELEEKKLHQWIETDNPVQHYFFTFSFGEGLKKREFTGTVSKASFEEKAYLICLMHDITEQVKLEEELYQSRKMDAIGQLAGGIAHDFNNMLAGIIGAAEVVKLSVKGESTGATMLDLILQTAGRASDLTAKLLAFSRKGKIRSTAIDVHKIIDETATIAQRSIDKKITLETNLSAKETNIVGDPSQIQNAILNLIINARDAIDGSGTISIKTATTCLNEEQCAMSRFNIDPGDYITITVTDSGCGIAPEVQDQIFEPFFTTKDTGKGTGLGLAAVYGTVVDHHGAISLESEIGSGTSFTLTLPLDELAQSHEQVDETTVRGTGTILLVDDEEIVRTTAKFILNDLGYDIVIAKDGEEALEFFNDEQYLFDLVILDMVMPKKNGEECFQEIRERDPHLPIILASGFPKSKRVETMCSQGLTAFIQKPFRRAILSHLIDEILHS